MNNVSKWLSGKGILFVALFSFAVLLADQVRIAAVWGAPNQYFTLFQIVGPIAGGFLGAAGGVASVLLAQIMSFIYLGKAFDVLNILRLSPMLFGAYYFAKFGLKKGMDGNYALLAPIAAILLFITNPIGAQVWYYALFWAIPVVAALFFANSLFARSLGASFTAHAIGGIVWLYLVPTTPAFWAALIPVVMLERLLFAAGISVSYVGFNTLLGRLDSIMPEGLLNIDRRYALFSKAAPLQAKRMRK
ncbi:MAG TPA: hypothetical protein VJI13_05620 [Candidatus Norongarragalinales archaeon]|nr:hypothetical protein [Candidatus Norongarragalinales archaeon]